MIIESKTDNGLAARLVSLPKLAQGLRDAAADRKAADEGLMSISNNPNLYRVALPDGGVNTVAYSPPLPNAGPGLSRMDVNAVLKTVAPATVASHSVLGEDLLHQLTQAMAMPEHTPFAQWAKRDAIVAALPVEFVAIIGQTPELWQAVAAANALLSFGDNFASHTLAIARAAASEGAVVMFNNLCGTALRAQQQPQGIYSGVAIGLLRGSDWHLAVKVEEI